MLYHCYQYFIIKINSSFFSLLYAVVARKVGKIRRYVSFHRIYLSKVSDLTSQAITILLCALTVIDILFKIINEGFLLRHKNYPTKKRISPNHYIYIYVYVDGGNGEKKGEYSGKNSFLYLLLIYNGAEVEKNGAKLIKN